MNLDELLLKIKTNCREMSNRYLEIAIQTMKAFEKLSEGPQAAIKAVDEVEMLEESINDHRLDLVKQVLKRGEEINGVESWFMILKNIEDVEDVVYHCEDVTDIIISMAIQG